VTGSPRGAVAAVALTALAACGAGEGGGRTLDVLAAASLTESFGELAEVFEAEHPGVRVRLVLESSATLAGQVAEGAPADVLATADESSMQRVVDAGAADRADVFATNRLVLVAPADNPAEIRSIADLDGPDVSYVACVETAPCGELASRLLAGNGVTAEPRSLEVDVKAVLAKVAADEADAGLVYATDARAADSGVQTFPVPGSEDELTAYPIAVVGQADEPGLAADWVTLTLSPEGQALFADAGFGPPDAGTW
jgi:molybdate transport system substrate-binding protein